MTTPELTRSSRYESAVCVSTGMRISLISVSALLIVLLLGRGIVYLDLGFRLQSTQRFVASDDNLVSGLQPFCDFDVGDARNSGVHRTEEGFLAVHDENALNFILFGIARRGGRRCCESHT